jgi:hypothetical protein
MGLSYDPFAAAEKSRTFFTGGGRQELLQRLLEQAHFGAPLSMVCGSLGSGKTTLAREFRACFTDEALCVPVQATLFMNQHQFLDALLEQLPIGASSPEPAAIVDDLIRFAEKLYLNAKTLVIIVDDAHELAINSARYPICFVYNFSNHWSLEWQFIQEARICKLQLHIVEHLIITQCFYAFFQHSSGEPVAYSIVSQGTMQHIG